MRDKLKTKVYIVMQDNGTSDVPVGLYLTKDSADKTVKSLKAEPDNKYLNFWICDLNLQT